MTAGPQTVVDRVTLIVSDVDRAEEDYVTTFGCSSNSVATSNVR